MPLGDPGTRHRTLDLNEDTSGLESDALPLAPVLRTVYRKRRSDFNRPVKEWLYLPPTHASSAASKSTHILSQNCPLVKGQFALKNP